MFRQADLSQFFLGNSVPLKRQNGKRTQRPWLVDTEIGMVCSYCKEQKKMKIHLLWMYKLQTSTPYAKL
jgi:hypothetical protein